MAVSAAWRRRARVGSAATSATVRERVWTVKSTASVPARGATAFAAPREPHTAAGSSGGGGSGVPGGRSRRSVERSVQFAPDGPLRTEAPHEPQRRAADRRGEPGTGAWIAAIERPSAARISQPFGKQSEPATSGTSGRPASKEEHVLGDVAAGPVEGGREALRRVERRALAADVACQEAQRRGLGLPGAGQGGEAGVAVLVEQAPPQRELGGQPGRGRGS